MQEIEQTELLFQLCFHFEYISVKCNMKRFFGVEQFGFCSNMYLLEQIFKLLLCAIFCGKMFFAIYFSNFLRLYNKLLG